MQPAWYVLRSRRPLARWFNLLHWPYTLWHLSYVVIGALLVPDPDWSLLSWTLLAFFLGMGVAAHAFDLLKGDPLRLGLGQPTLRLVGLAALFGACVIGVTLWVLVLDDSVARVWSGLVVFFGAILAIGYGSEMLKLHGNVQFAFWWAVFPLLVAYFAQAGEVLSLILLPACLYAFYTAWAQRILSNRSRYLRREVGEAQVRILEVTPGSLEGAWSRKDAAWLLAPSDTGLAALNIAVIAVAGVLVLARL